jgi:hypothetical protein
LVTPAASKRLRTLRHIALYSSGVPEVPFKVNPGQLGVATTSFSGSWCRLSMTLVSPKDLMLAAMVSICALTAGSLPSAELQSLVSW